MKAIRILCLIFLLTPIGFTKADRRIGNVANRVVQFQNRGVVFENINLLEKSSVIFNDDASQALGKYRLLTVNNQASALILSSKPDYIRLSIPYGNSLIEAILYKVNISPSGFTLEVSDGNRYSELNTIVHYRGMIENDPYSVAGLSVSENEVTAIISNDEGNFVVGKMEGDNGNVHVIYNDKDLLKNLSYECGTNTSIPVNPIGEELMKLNPANAQSTNCVNWYYETDYDLFVNKGSVAAVNTYIQGIFNNVATLYDNDGVSIALQTLFVWNAADPYTGPSTSNYLNQFGAYRTSFAGDLANLVGLSGGGGIAYVNSLCSSGTSVRMSYSGISSSYNNVPTYSWTVEVITHEDGHLLGSRHTHDCVWNGNNTRIDNCGPQAGYNSGSCAAGPIPASGTIMSYCHLVGGVGINFNLGFGPQPATLILNNVNNASCLQSCTPCPAPTQPGNISGAVTYCGVTSQTYTVSAVGGATGYIWSLPSGWTGTSSTNSITVTTAATGGTISVSAYNACDTSVARTLSVNGNSAPGQIGNLQGSTVVCSGSFQTYTISPVSGATSYNWTLPSGWTGTSTTNTIVVTVGTTGGTLSVVAVNSCGNSSPRSITVTVNSSSLTQPGTITPSGGTAKVCPGNTRTYTISPVAGATSYTWTPPTGGTIVGGQGTTSVNISYNSLFTAADTLHVVAQNSCGVSPQRTRVILRNNPAKPSVISGPSSGVCGLANAAYSVTQVNGITYQWSYSQPGATITGGQGTNSITASYASNAQANILSVAATNGCGASVARTLNIATIPARPGVITGTSSPCIMQQGVPYSITPVAGASSYTWNVPSGARINDGTITSTNASLTTTASDVFVNFKTADGNIRVRANNSCGSSSNRILAVGFACREGEFGTPDETEFEIYPTASSETITIRLRTFNGESAETEIMNLSGKVVSRIRLTDTETVVDIRSLPAGIYAVRMLNQGKSTSQRFIRQ